MRYAGSELRDRLAAEYVLGTMPPLARRRFERLIAAEPEVARLVAEWNTRFAPLDAATTPETPPARVWRGIERRLPGSGAGAGTPAAWFGRLAVWRGLALATSAALVALIVYVLAGIGPQTPNVVAVLADKAGAPFWVVTRSGGEARFSAVQPLPADRQHALELWGIAPGTAPHALGLLPQTAGASFAVSRNQLPPAGGTLAVSLEPPKGSPTGQPTGPVLWQGKIIAEQ